MNEKTQRSALTDNEVAAGWRSLMMRCALLDDDLWNFYEPPVEEDARALDGCAPAGLRFAVSEHLRDYYGLQKLDMETIVGMREEAEALAQKGFEADGET